METVELILAAIGILGSGGIFGVYTYIGRRADKQDDKISKQDEKMDTKLSKEGCAFNMGNIKREMETRFGTVGRETKAIYEILTQDVNEIKTLIKDNRDAAIVAREDDREVFNKFQLKVVDNLAAINTKLKGKDNPEKPRCY